MFHNLSLWWLAHCCLGSLSIVVSYFKFLQVLSNFALKTSRVPADVRSSGRLFQSLAALTVKKFPLLMFSMAAPQVFFVFLWWFCHFPSASLQWLSYQTLHWVSCKLQSSFPRFLVKSRVGRSSFINLCSKGRDAREGMSLVARLWTFSRLVLCFWKCGCHAWLQYSKWGLTSVLISTLSDWQFNFMKHFSIIASIEFAFLIFSAICKSKFSLWSVSTPKSFSHLTFSNIFVVFMK